MHIPQGRGYVTRLTILVPAHTEGAFNGVPSLQDLVLPWKNDFDWLVGVFGVLDMLI